MADERAYWVVIPGYVQRGKGRKLKRVSYPASGHPLYTRAEAVALLVRRYERMAEAGVPLPTTPYEEAWSHPLTPWAEGPSERFTLLDVDGGKHLPKIKEH